MKSLALNLILLTFCIVKTNAQDFSYDSTQDKSISKFHRIQAIEKYLSDLPSKISKMENSLKQDQKKGDDSLKKDFEDLKSQISALEKSIVDLKKGKKGEKSDEDLKKENEELKK